MPKLGLPVAEVASTLDALERERARIQHTVPKLFNEHFGSIFRHRSDSTAYAFAALPRKEKAKEEDARASGANANETTRNAEIFERKSSNFHYKMLHRSVYSEVRLKKMNKSNGICKVCLKKR